MQTEVVRKNIRFLPDARRVIARFLFVDENRAKNTIRSVLNTEEDQVTSVLSPILRDFSLRHRNISKIFEKHFNNITHLIRSLNIDPDSIQHSKKILLGSYFTMEYSIEAAAFLIPL